MYTIDHFIAAFAKECRICLQLYGKMPAGGLDYRPTAGQRSTVELLRYVSYGPYNGVRRVLAGDFTLGISAVEATKDMPPSDFPRRMAWQEAEVERMARAADPEDLRNGEIRFPWGEVMKKAWGEVMKKGEALVAHPLKWITAYRMQLFLYLKAAGAADLATPDIWHAKGG
jgi:hypothetical protein